MKLYIDYSKVRVLITGSQGMVGTELKKRFPNGKNILCPTQQELDLTDYNKVEKYFKEHEPEYIFHLAARVGGILANMNGLAEFYTDNILMNTNVLHCAYKYKAKKVVSLLSTCVYPDIVEYPLKEKDIHNGPPHESNFAYAYAKRMLDVQSRAYRKQYGCDFITAIPNNLYGSNDNFDLKDSHVIPAIMRKVYEAKTSITLWGDGTPLREFTHVSDVADALLFLVEHYSGEGPINIGNTEEYSIGSVAEMIINIMEKKCAVIWDTQKPSGQYRKPSDNGRFIKLLKETGQGFAYCNLYDDGLVDTCKWFKENYPNVRGIK